MKGHHCEKCTSLNHSGKEHLGCDLITESLSIINQIPFHKYYQRKRRTRFDINRGGTVCSSSKLHATPRYITTSWKVINTLTRNTRERVRSSSTKRGEKKRSWEIVITVSETAETAEQLSLTLNILRYACTLPVERDRGGVRAAVTFKEEQPTSDPVIIDTFCTVTSYRKRNILDDVPTFPSPPLLSLCEFIEPPLRNLLCRPAFYLPHSHSITAHNDAN